MRDPGGHDQAGPCLLSYGQSCDLCAHRNSLPRYTNIQKSLSLDQVLFPQMASPMTFQSWPPSEHQALRTKGSCSQPTARTAASSSPSRFVLILIQFEVEVEQLFVKVARRLVFIYKDDGGGGKQRLRFKLKLSLNK